MGRGDSSWQDRHPKKPSSRRKSGLKVNISGAGGTGRNIVQ